MKLERGLRAILSTKNDLSSDIYLHDSLFFAHLSQTLFKPTITNLRARPLPLSCFIFLHSINQHVCTSLFTGLFLHE